MTDRQLVSIMAAIIAAPVDRDGDPAYPIEGAVERALRILQVIEGLPGFRRD
jgi:hypothetical protein